MRLRVLVQGPTNTTASAKWLPFDPPTQADVIVSPQLDQLIKQFTTPNTGPAYLQSFYDMITSAIVNMPFAPPEYAAFASAIVGKPLALTNVGLSLELATQPLESQVTLPMPAPITPGQEEILKYKFPIKIGDADRPFDGVVGYFDTDNTTAGSTTWTKLHTYFTSSSATPPTAPQTGDPRVIIAPSDFPTLSPYYIHPDGPLKLSSYLAESATKLVVKTMLLDPYTPIHVYSPILPITELKLSAWNVQTALQRMTAFFTLGPCLLTRDVPKVYDATNPLAPTTWLEDQKKLAAGAEPETAKIRLPIAGKKGLWNWLQPYVVDGPEGGEEKRRYNGMAVGEEGKFFFPGGGGGGRNVLMIWTDGRIRMDPAPYTLVEGFLQLARPLGTDDVRM